MNQTFAKESVQSCARTGSIKAGVAATLMTVSLLTGCGGGGQGSTASPPAAAATVPTVSPSSGSTDPVGNTEPVTGSGSADTASVPCVAPAGGASQEAKLRVIAGSETTAGEADGTAQTARFNFPGVLAGDAKGNLYVADDGNRKIRKVCAGGNVNTVADIGALGAFAVTGIAVDGQGTLYYSDVVGVHRLTSAGSQIQLGNELVNPGRLAISSAGALYTFENRYLSAMPDASVTQAPAGLRRLDGLHATHLWDYGMFSPQGSTNNQDGFTDIVLDEAAGKAYIVSDLFNVVARLSYGTAEAGTHYDVPGITLPGSRRIQRLAKDTSGGIYAFTNVLGAVYRILPDGSVTAVAGEGTNVALPSAGRLEIRSIVGTGPKTFAFTSGHAVYELKLP